VTSDLFGQDRIVPGREAECRDASHGGHPRKGVYQARAEDRGIP
jgi:hypothetical protein